MVAMANSFLIILVSVLLLIFVVLRVIFKLIIIFLALAILILSIVFIGTEEGENGSIKNLPKSTDIKVLVNEDIDKSKDSKNGDLK
jgi:uncharacterized SAM-binding protein YcdF (DUF218 family)